MDFTHKEVIEIFENSMPLDIELEIDEFVIEQTFPGTYKKSFYELITELKELNICEDEDLITEEYDKITYA